MGGLATAKLITNWFNKRRGTALGIAATGISVSGVVMPFISAAIIETWGWRQGFLLYALFTGLVVVPLVIRLVISAPEDIGLKPDGALVKWSHESQHSDSAAIQEGQSALKQANFWLFVLIMSLLFCCQSATLIHMVPRLTDAGNSLPVASLVMSVCAGFGVLGKLSFGWIGDRWRVQHALWLTICTQIIGQLAMFQEHFLPVFIVGAALFGFGMGGSVPLQNTVVGKVFGRARFGRTLGLMRPAMFPIQIIGVPLAGWVFDATGTYTPAFIIFVALYCLAAGIVFIFRPSDVDYDNNPAAEPGIIASNDTGS